MMTKCKQHSSRTITLSESEWLYDVFCKCLESQKYNTPALEIERPNLTTTTEDNKINSKQLALYRDLATECTWLTPLLRATGSVVF